MYGVAMRPGLKGNQLPESEADYAELLKTNRLRYTNCCFCDRSHVGKTHTRLGWAETQISGSCEDCYDELFEKGDKK